MDIKQKIEKANEEAVHRLTAGEPVLVDIAPAGEVIPGMKDRMITHAGPPIEWSRMCGAQQGAIIGMSIYEGWAKTPDEARKMLDKGEIQLEPNHHHQTVGPMAGTISPSAPVWVVENKAFGNRAFCRQVEGNRAVRRLQRPGAARSAHVAGRVGTHSEKSAAYHRWAGPETNHHQSTADGRRTS